MAVSNDSITLVSSSRPTHVFLLTICPYIAYLLKTTIQDESSNKSVRLVQQVCYIILPCLPIVWFLGLLPTLEPLFFWIIEQVQIFAFGGSASASPSRSVFYIVLSMLAYALVYVGSGDVFWTMIWSCVVGYLLSLDWFGYLESVFRLLRHKCNKSTDEENSRNENSGEFAHVEQEPVNR